MQRAAVASVVGARMLNEIEEGSLEELLTSLRTNFTTLANSDFNDHAATHDDADTDHTSSQKLVIAPTTTTTKPEPRHFPIPFLNELVQRHFRATSTATLSISGRHYELLYLLVATLIAPPHRKTVAILDLDGRFDPLRLLATTTPFCSPPTGTPSTHHLDPSDLDHVHILRPPPPPCRSNNASVPPLHTYLVGMEEYMLYAPHKSREREWWGTIVIGGSTGNTTTASTTSSNNHPAAAQVAVTAGRQGWLRVDRAEVTTTGAGASWTLWNKSAEEARAEREERERAVEEGGWVASSAWGTFVFGSGSGSIG
ncbi:hypothetical protein NCU05817 [Neurospora crassa OR74A]|uniref:Uncharacterized protein n=1 Tax=Neurospora crassa (strain ATCC 24698 / 74-OR23-1A / CBS 708.71 / DSM 1257 / FGSC 987) TaxID=367110 RepID=Q7S5M6_NEUCR|nr:hypothetical protein NCU05817 [Neurospora crassa OR74A]EAA30841.1 hypothetical protein NCU05817 [Neurospora crassa OR74A]|eukprot:XP_960077.1 hypothetical protein NCU05817 [Neurospora crassa OR74A]